MNATHLSMVGAFGLSLLVASNTFAKDVNIAPASSISLDDPVSPPDDLPPHGDVLRMADVCELVVDGGRLALRTRMPANGQVQTLDVPVEGLRGANTIRVEREGVSDEPQLYYFVNNDTDQPDASLVQTQVSLTSGQLLIHQHVQTKDGWKVISLAQGSSDADGAVGSGGAITLTVTRGNAPDKRVQCSASDWVTFRRMFPREVNAHLRPLFRMIRQERVFAISPVVAWQVFQEERSIDTGVRERVVALLPELDAENFATRHRAWCRLRDEGMAAALFLNNFDTSRLSPEQAARVEGFLAGFPLLSDEEVVAMRSDSNFLLDCLYGADEEIRQIAQRRLTSVLRHEVDVASTTDEARVCSQIDRWRGEVRTLGMAQASSR